MKTTTITWTGRYLLVGDRGVTTRRTTEYYLPLVGKVSIGCDQRNSIVLERPGVQNQHCTLFVTGGAVFVHVDDSEADTRVNGSRVRGDELLYDSDCLTVGSVDFKLALLRPTIRAGLGKSVAGQHVTRLVFESEFASRDEPSEPPTVVSGARRATELPSVGDQDDNPTPAHRPCVECLDDVVGSRCDNCGAPLIVGGYRVTRLVHHGEFRNLYLAEHRDTGDRCYALKEIRFASVPGAKQLDAFEREGQILRQLNHPNIPRFVSSFRDGQGLGLRVYLAQEFVKGKPVSALREGCFDVTSAADIAHKVLPILDYLHGLALPVVHRDVKPDNLLLQEDGTLALVDFGSAREVKQGGTYGATTTGTLGFAPPESLGGSLDQTADLYGLGATLIYLLTRQAPFDVLFNDGQESDLGRVIHGPRPFLRWLSKMTAFRRIDRFDNSSQARQALLECGYSSFDKREEAKRRSERDHSLASRPTLWKAWKKYWRAILLGMSGPEN